MDTMQDCQLQNPFSYYIIEAAGNATSSIWGFAAMFYQNKSLWI
jgi:hypothetical protein